MDFDIPSLGTLTLAAILVSASYTFAVSVAAARGRPHLLRSARFGTLATIALVATAVFLLAYAFQAHDFRIRYVARYSDRSMPAIYLWTALWGGQDGSLLWWTFLLSGYIGAFTWWVKDKYRALQPVMFAILMSIIAFFVVLQLFAANPFATTFSAPPPDGEGLNPLLQNYWMIIHPPALYMGLTGWAIPFAFVMAALITGRLNEEWVRGVRRWVLLAWGFLSLGNMLGMFWSYEELGWGGYWAWDPVENASFLPWLTGTAYLHSVMIQERRGTFKVWNVGLLATTFILTIFGTFLTRSGLIASVHSFARSNIGEYFAYYLAGLCVFVLVVIGWRLPDLRGGRRLGLMEFGISVFVGVLAALVFAAFGITNSVLGLLGTLAFFPLLVAFLKFIELQRGTHLDWKRAGSGALPVIVIAVARVSMRGLRQGWWEALAIGVAFVALLLLLKALSMISPPLSEGQLGGGRRGIESVLSREFAFLLNNWILLGMAVFVILATTFPLLSEWLRGETVTVGPGYYNKWMVPFGLILLTLTGIGPLIAWRKATGRNLIMAFRWPSLFAAIVFVAFLLGGSSLGYPPTVAWDDIYETWVGQALAAVYSVMPLLSVTVCAFVIAAVVQEFWRGTAVRVRTKGENVFLAFLLLVWRGRRRYGGYIVHTGIVVMFLGFTGAAYDVEGEAALLPGESMTVGEYEFRYDGVQMEEDPNKRMIFTDVSVLHDGEVVNHARPARYVYRSHPEMPTTEVEIRTGFTKDLYVIMSAVDPQTRRGTFRVIVRPVVLWIWLGGLIMLCGVFIAILPSLTEVLGMVTVSRPMKAVVRSAALVFLVGSASWALAPPTTVHAQSDSSSSLHAGTVEIHDPEERRLFSRLLCECGGCQRLPLSTCGCSWAEGLRAELRGRMAQGESANALIADYRDRFGAQAIAIPSDEGLDRALWAVPVAAFVLAAFGLGFVALRWQRSGASETAGDLAHAADAVGESDDGLEARLDDELDALEGD